jgi:hypothetical protein
MPSPITITAPATTVTLADNRMGEMSFTVANMTDQPVQGRTSVVPLDDAPAGWFKVTRGAELTLPARSSAQVLVQVDPPLGVVASTHQFRVDVTNPATPEMAAFTGPSCEFVVPPSEPKFSWKTPRGYLTTLIGASVGGLVGELIMLVSILLLANKDCGADASCALGQIALILLAVLVGAVLMWIGSFIGAGVALRVRKYLGSKTTALFLAILMVPWTFPMAWLLGQITDNILVLLILTPILLTAVPGVLARGAVLLIRTKHI